MLLETTYGQTNAWKPQGINGTRSGPVDLPFGKIIILALKIYLHVYYNLIKAENWCHRGIITCVCINMMIRTGTCAFAYWNGLVYVNMQDGWCLVCGLVSACKDKKNVSKVHIRFIVYALPSCAFKTAPGYSAVDRSFSMSDWRKLAGFKPLPCQESVSSAWSPYKMFVAMKILKQAI